MGFNLIPQQESLHINIDSLTQEMINDLIICYTYDIPASDVEARYLITERTGLVPLYPIISANVVNEFYGEVDKVSDGIVNIILENYHMGLYEDNRDGEWIQGTTPLTIDELKDVLFYIIKRDFNESGTWLYDFSQGDIELLKPFTNKIVDLIILNTANNDYKNFISLIKNKYNVNGW